MLLYATKGGFSYGDIQEMHPRERQWFVRRLTKQLKKEADVWKRKPRKR